MDKNIKWGKSKYDIAREMWRGIRGDYKKGEKTVNKVIIIGNLGRDPEINYTSSGMAVCKMAIATSHKYKNKNGEMVDDTQWHNVVVWGKQGENCKEFLKKGRKCAVEGRLQTRKWQDKDGVTRYTTEIVADRVEFLGGQGEATGHKKNELEKKIEDEFEAEVTDYAQDEIPF